jgi:hypothetical protein
MLRIAFVICVEYTFYRFTVNADSPAGIHGIGCAVPASLLKAVAAGIILLLCAFAANHDITFAATSVIIVGTIVYSAF